MHLFETPYGACGNVTLYLLGKYLGFKFVAKYGDYIRTQTYHTFCTLLTILIQLIMLLSMLSHLVYPSFFWLSSEYPVVF